MCKVLELFSLLRHCTRSPAEQHSQYSTPPAPLDRASLVLLLLHTDSEEDAHPLCLSPVFSLSAMVPSAATEEKGEKKGGRDRGGREEE